MTAGDIVEEGQTEQVFTEPRHDYTRRLLAAEPKGDPQPVEERAPIVLQASDPRVWFPIQRGLLKRTVAHIKAVDRVNVTVRARAPAGVVGESGSGQATLALALLRLQQRPGRPAFLGPEVPVHDRRNHRPWPGNAARLPGPLPHP